MTACRSTSGYFYWRPRVRCSVAGTATWRTSSACPIRSRAGRPRWWRDRRPRWHDGNGPTHEVEAPPLTHANGLGGFTAGGREYAIVLNGDADTPLPWVNVIANERFGTVVGATGAAWTWAANSRENRLTPFGNDPVSEFSGEAVYLRDEDRGNTWGATPGPLPRRRDDGRWVTRHGAGVTRYAHSAHGITCQLAVFVHADEPVKLSWLSLTNHDRETRRLSVFAYNEWALCPPRAGEHRFVITEQDPATGAGAGAQSLQLRLPGTRGVRARERAARIGDRRPARVPGAERLAAAAGGPGA